jgi:hypothetical protein
MHLAEDAIPERQVMGVCTHNELGNLHFATFKAFLLMSKSTISLEMVWKYLESSPPPHPKDFEKLEYLWRR